MDSRKKKRVFLEDVKARHTTHWDMDYLTRAELDELYRKNQIESEPDKSPPKWYFRPNLLKAALGAAVALMIASITLLIIT